ncbi:MAG: hypothetical protein QM817_29670 [Archangium sp.]
MKLLRVASAVSVVVLFAACPPKPAGSCGGTECSSMERCVRDSLTCVPDLPPAIVLNVPAVVSEPTFQATGSVTDDDSLKSAEWRSGSGDWTVIPLASDGTFTFAVPAPEFDAQDVVVSIRARDAIQEATLSQAAKVDRVGPKAELVSPDAGSAHATATIQAAVKVSDGSGAISELTVNGMVITNPVSGATVMATVNVPANADGAPVLLPVTARDSRGNASSTTFTFVGDRVPPQVSITSPTMNQMVTTAMLTVTFTAIDSGGIASANCSDTSGGSAMATQTAPNTWSCDLPVALVERAETVSVAVLDLAGNLTNVSQVFQIDRIAPTVTLNAPVAGFIMKQALAVSATTSGDAQTVTVRFMGGAPVSLSGGPPAWTGSLPLPAHDYAAETVLVEARDAAGNVGTAMASGFTDTVVPVITFTEPIPGNKFNIASFTSGTTVRTAWTITDADPMAHTVTVNGTASTALQLDLPTRADDNPREYDNDIVVTDRAGNTATSTMNYWVDRVAPTLMTFEPSDGARNLVPREIVVAFSEPIRPNASGMPVVIAPAGTVASQWDAPRHRWSGGVQALALQTITVSPATDLADDFGNPVAPFAARRFYVGTDRAANNNQRLSTNAADFDATSDPDGITTVVMSSGGRLDVQRDDGNTMSPVATSVSRTDLVRVTANSWATVNGTTLMPSNRFGLVAFGTGSWTRLTSIDGVQSTDTGNATQVGVVSQPGMGYPSIPQANPMPFEGTALIGTITDSTFTRSPKTWSLPWSPNGLVHVLQSNTSWVATNNTGINSLEWVRFYCGQGAFGLYCSSTLYRSTGTGPAERGSAMTRGGACAAIAWSNRIVFQTRPACESNGTVCANDLNVTSVARLSDERFAPDDSPGNDSLLIAFRSGNAIGISRMAAGTCGLTGAAVLVAAVVLPFTTTGGPDDFLPVRVGTHVGVVYRVGTSVYLHTFW